MARSFRAEPTNRQHRKARAYKRLTHATLDRELGDYILY
jgi:hypothetical protein